MSIESAVAVSVVAPCYNEAEGIDAFYDRVSAACKGLGLSYEIVLVNDGSTDATWERITEISDADPAVVGVDLSRNHGHQLALTAGLQICRGRRVLIIDADGQDPPELLPEMMALMDQGADVIYGQRMRRLGEGRFKRWTAKVFYRLLSRLTHVKIPVDTGDFRLISRRALDIFLAMGERHRFIRGMVAWIGFTQKPLQYERAARETGATHYTLGKMVGLALDAVTSFSVVPLRIATFVGLLASLAAMAAGAYAVVGWMLGRTVSGWTSLLAVITFIGAIQLLVLGILGEYVGRLYEQSKGRPLYVVRQIVRTESAVAADDDESESETK